MKTKLFATTAWTLIALFLFSCKKQVSEKPITTNNGTPKKTSTYKVEEAFPGIQGVPKTGLFRGQMVKYISVNDVKVFEGDILIDLDPTQSTHSTGRTEANYKWSGGVVYYTVDPYLPDQYRIYDAISHWQNKTGITFVPRSSQTDYVTFKDNGLGCSSYVGKTGGQQMINIEGGCSIGSVIHEIGHAVGLFHEQSRLDANNYITINYANIQSGMEHNFNTYLTGGYDGFDLYGTSGLDFGSIMMYGPYAFTNNGLPTITLANGSSYTVQRDSLSADDIAGVNYMYFLPTKISKLSFGADGSLYAIGTVKATTAGNGIFQRVGSSWKQTVGSALTVAVAPNGVPWVINELNAIWMKYGSSWVSQTGAGTEIAIAPNGSRFVLGTSYIDANGYAIYQSSGSGYVQLSGSAVKVAADPYGTPWVINSSGNIYKRNGSGWVQISGSARDIAIGADGSIYVVGTIAVDGNGYRIYKWVNNAFALVSGNGSGTGIAVSPAGVPYIVNAVGDVFYYNSGSWTQLY